VASQGTAEQIASFHATGILPTPLIQMAQWGIIMSGLVSIAAGFLVRYSGKNAVEKLLPATITGSISMIIGLTLAGNALTDAAPSAAATGILSSSWVWVVSLVTLLSTILFSRYLKGFLGQLPLLLGAGVGCITAGHHLLHRRRQHVPRNAGGSTRCFLSTHRRMVRSTGLLNAETELGSRHRHHADRDCDHPGIHCAYLSRLTFTSMSLPRKRSPRKV
jgi:hypothetical protein